MIVAPRSTASAARRCGASPPGCSWGVRAAYSLVVQAPAAVREVAAAKGALQADAGASLRAAQAGFALALALILVWIWISFRRGGGGR